MMQVNETYLGDCLGLMPLVLEDKSIDMIFCDLPYGTTQNKWDSVLPLGELWEEYERVIKDRGAIVLFAQTPFDKVLGASNLKLLRYEWVWEKDRATGHLNSKKMPMKAHENLLVFYKKLPTYNPQKTEGHRPANVSSAESQKASTNYGHFRKISTGGQTDRFPRSVLKFNGVNSASGVLHPTQKPLALIEYMISTYTKEGDLVLDNCCGSGTVGLGCKNLGRNYIMMEQDPAYYEIARSRVGESLQ
jgi:site-specific DNA-methyltransferase (adenine-specific)